MGQDHDSLPIVAGSHETTNAFSQLPHALALRGIPFPRPRRSKNLTKIPLQLESAAETRRL
jgi:hypothetical protein